MDRGRDDPTGSRSLDRLLAGALPILIQTGDQIPLHVEPILDAAPDGVVVADEQGRIVYANARTEDLFGYDRDEMIGETVETLVPEDVRHLHENHREGYMDEPVRRPMGRDMDLRGRRKDGTEFPVEISLSPLRTESGTTVVAIVRDISDRRRLEEDAREQRRRNRMIADALSALDHGVVITEGATIEQVSDAIPRLYGYPEEELIGRNFLELLPPTEAERLMDGFEALLDGDKEESMGETTVIRGDGTPLDIEYATRTVQQDGVTRFFSVVRDMTKRRELEHRAEDEARQREIILHAISGLGQGVVLVDGEEIVHVNDAASELLGYDADELEGQGFLEFLPPDALEEVGDRFLRMVTGVQDEARGETTALRKDGSTVEIEYAAKTLHQDEDQTRILAIIRDISEAKELQRDLARWGLELKRSNEELEQFAYVASHDLQEPLRTMTRYVQMLDRTLADEIDDETREYLDFVVHGSRRMQKLIDALLSFSRVGRQRRELAPTDLGDALETALSNLREPIERSGAEITADPLPTVEADETQMVQLFQNLVGNAIKFQPPDRTPRVHVTAEEADEVWRVEVEDNGIGIDEDTRDRIFSIFQRLHTDEAYEGTGVGLAICRKIVEGHGGEIQVDSEPGTGSTFWFTLPKTPSLPVAEMMDLRDRDEDLDPDEMASIGDRAQELI